MMEVADLPIRSIFYVSSIIGIVLVFFLLKTADKIDDETGLISKRPWLSWARRLSMLGQIFAMSLCVIYGYQQNWDPWPPFVLWVIACDIQHLVRILTSRDFELFVGSSDREKQPVRSRSAVS